MKSLLLRSVIDPTYFLKLHLPASFSSLHKYLAQNVNSSKFRKVLFVMVLLIAFDWSSHFLRMNTMSPRVDDFILLNSLAVTYLTLPWSHVLPHASPFVYSGEAGFGGIAPGFDYARPFSRSACQMRLSFYQLYGQSHERWRRQRSCGHTCQ